MRLTLELLRITVFLGVLGILGWTLLINVYPTDELTQKYAWLGGLALFILLFILYRNKIQFSGWYTGEKRKKLSKNVSRTLILLSIILIITPFILSAF